MYTCTCNGENILTYVQYMYMKLITCTLYLQLMHPLILRQRRQEYQNQMTHPHFHQHEHHVLTFLMASYAYEKISCKGGGKKGEGENRWKERETDRRKEWEGGSIVDTCWRKEKEENTIYRVIFMSVYFLQFGTKEDFMNLNFCEKASDQRKPRPCNTQLINPKAKGHAY